MKSGVLFRPDAPSDCISAVIDHLLDLALKKSWLREPASKGICSLISSLSQLKTGKAVAQEIADKVEAKGLARSQDGAAIFLALHSLSKALRPSSKVWVNGDPMDISNSSLFIDVLKEMATDDDSTTKSGNAKTHPHFVWTFIVQRYAAPSSGTVKSRLILQNVVAGTITLQLC